MILHQRILELEVAQLGKQRCVVDTIRVAIELGGDVSPTPTTGHTPCPSLGLENGTKKAIRCSVTIAPTSIDSVAGQQFG